MDLEELKNTWQNLNIRVSQLEEDNRRTANALSAGRAQSAQAALAKMYKVSGCAGLLLPGFAPMIVKILGLPLWVAVIYAVFGVLMSILSFCFSAYIMRTDVINCPVVQAMKHVVAIRKYQGRIRIMGIFLGSAVLLSMLAVMLRESEIGLIIGFVGGLIIGLPVAIFKIRRQIRLTRQIQSALEEVRE